MGSNEAGLPAQLLNGGTHGACEIAVLMLDILMCRNGRLGHACGGSWGGGGALNVDPEELLGGGGLAAQSWTVACQAPLSMRFPRHEYWSG